LAGDFDHRVYALSPGSRALLEELSVWGHINSERIAPIRAMEVFGDSSSRRGGEIEFSAAGPMAYIIEHAALLNALQAAIAERGERIRIIDNVELAGIDFAGGGPAANIRLANQRSLAAELLVAADGSASQVRAMAGIGTRIKDYQSDGVVANFHIGKAHGGIARQWFSPQGVLAYLPLPGDQMSIVWSVSASRAAELEALEDEGFADAVAAAGSHVLGSLRLASTRARIPLKRIIASSWVKPGLALIGDAAHAMHPLAGQGANIGFGDVRTLYRALRDRSALSGAGDLAVLRQYERERREDAFLMGEMTDNLQALYLSDLVLAKVIRRRGLDQLNRLPAAKALLVAHAIK
jgi:ubiquinone biosynthesis UbiH/UbiF/VisC/COQ6 family hydroxylase